ncbi:hypothetical protein EK21DRAFT_118515 [Setomelanomma holmii]|uniref:Uncharacterized protein n=1 Tax=Setomelanomma holmii TaxID=210430 RepID=A0A9P4GXB4_9PLEO|nr:hypothetical protein EK21DRAFT_118515 [Setomelanomma holmii]
MWDEGFRSDDGILELWERVTVLGRGCGEIGEVLKKLEGIPSLLYPDNLLFATTTNQASTYDTTISLAASFDMNSHFAPRARVHDYEEQKSNDEIIKIQRLADSNEEQGELDAVEASAEAEIEV